MVNEELASLADRVLDGEITETVAGKERTMTADEPAQAAYYATWRTEIYKEEPAAVLDYTGNIPSDWREYHDDELDEFQAMAKASFEQELHDYLQGYAEGDME